MYCIFLFLTNNNSLYDNINIDVFFKGFIFEVSVQTRFTPGGYHNF